MKKAPAPAHSVQHEYERLRKSLARIGYITQGSVLDRSTLQPPRSGFQWTRKVAGKTITVALNRQQFEAFTQAVDNERNLWEIIRKMERISRRILFETQPHTLRRKHLSNKVLGLI